MEWLLKKLKEHYSAILIVLAVLLVLTFIMKLVVSRDGTFGQGNPFESDYQVLLDGVKLSSGYTGAGSASSTARVSNAMPNLAFALQYTPRSHGAKVQVLLERSLDVNCTNFYPFTVIEPTAAYTNLYASGTTGIPFLFPADITAASGTTYNVTFDMTGVAQCIKLSAKEMATSTNGALSAQVLLNSN